MEIRRQKIARDLCEQPYLSTLFINLFPPDIPCQQTFPAPQESLKGRAYGQKLERLEKKFWSHSNGLCAMASSFAQIQTGWASHFGTSFHKSFLWVSMPTLGVTSILVHVVTMLKIVWGSSSGSKSSLIQGQSSSSQLAPRGKMTLFQLLQRKWIFISFLWDPPQVIGILHSFGFQSLHVSSLCSFLSQTQRGNNRDISSVQIRVSIRTISNRDSKDQESLRECSLWFLFFVASCLLAYSRALWFSWEMSHLFHILFLLIMTWMLGASSTQEHLDIQLITATRSSIRCRIWSTQRSPRRMVHPWNEASFPEWASRL